ncbi:MAG: hypothetical protein QXW79_01515 [Thermoplasmata archaeon]
MIKNRNYTIDVLLNDRKKSISWNKSIEHNSTIETSIRFRSELNNKEKTEINNDKLNYLNGKKISKKHYRKE